ncbi:heparinase II/III domain-containing protein [Ulvibacterium marinum]|uniref:heparinase II/III domain-containing protein n=1 Tax=Ulvibacterium marinum TaxID=2419782 RepID=UPI00249598E0|nr:heparinase II/III family protein [Ulvibacterium marinum]
MMIGRPLGLLILCGLYFQLSFSQTFENLVEEHPRLFITSNTINDVKKRIGSDTRYALLHEQILKNCDSLLNMSPALEIKEGRRLLEVSRTYLKRILYLAYAYRITGQRPYFEKAKQEMLAASAFSSWNPSHYLDVTEMAMGLAIGYDWLFHDLSTAERETIASALLEKGIRTSIDKTLEHGWISSSNNWNPVCHGGLTAAAIAIFDFAPDVCTTVIKRSIENVPEAMKEYAANGNYPEGPMYWSYGTTYNVLLVAALQTAFDSDFGLLSKPGFLETANYYRHVIGPSGLYFNYSDSREIPGLNSAQFYFSKEMERPELLWQEMDILESYSDGERNFKASGISNRFLPFILLWSLDMPEVRSSNENQYIAHGTTPIAIYRSSWSDSALYLGIKAGSPSANHAHMDIGSFVFEKHGIRWASDLGLQGYHSLESLGLGIWKKDRGSDRWKVFRNNVFSHNTLVVNDSLQNPEAFATIEKIEDDTHAFKVTTNLSEIYAPQLAYARRTFEVRQDQELVITDSLRTAKTGDAKIRWAFVTPAEVEIAKDGRAAYLSKEGQSITVKLLRPEGTSFKIYKTDPPPSEFDASNPGTRLLGFEVFSTKDSKEIIQVKLK